MPGDSFLKTFVTYVSSRTEAPPDYHLHAGMVTLSAALGTRVWCDGRSRPIYPNLWVILIGGSGIGKSVPLDMSLRLIQMAGLGENVLSDSFSAEALYDEFKRIPTRVAYFQEFASFMGLLNREYNAGCMQWLTDVYDVPDEIRRTLRQETLVIRRPFLTILGASTPEWFAGSFKESNLGGGFLGRFAYCPVEQRTEYVPDPGPHNEATLAMLADHVRQVRQLSGKADFRAVLGPQSRYETWEREQRDLLRTGSIDPIFQGMRGRGGVLAKKAAILYHVSTDPTNLIITDRDMEQAIRYVERSHKLAETYLSTRVAFGRDDADTLKVYDTISRLGGVGVARSAVLRSAHMSAGALDRAIRTLVESERIAAGKSEGATVYNLATAGPTLRIVPPRSANGGGQTSP